MAPSPTTSALGAVADLGRPAASAPANASSKGEGVDNKSSFSTVLEDARSVAPDAGQAAEKAVKPAVAELPAAAEAATAMAADTLDALVLLKGKLANLPANTATDGKPMPPTGEELPAQPLADAALLVAAADAVPEKHVGSAKAASRAVDTLTGDNAAVPAPATPVLVQPPIVPLLPESPAQTAAALLASRGTPAVPAEDGQSTTGVSEVATAQKRAVPTPSQALIPEMVSGAPEALVESAARQSDAVPSAKVTASLGAAAEQVSDTTQDMPPALIGKKAENTPAAGDAIRAEVGEFRDVLKQIDNTLASTATSGSDITTVTSARDSGLRQYIDASPAAGRVDVPVGKPGWGEAVADKVMWMSAQNINSAEIHLNPPDLGPLSVRVSSHQDQTSVFFTSSHVAVRDALDQSLPRLRDMLGGQGIQLLDVGVGDQGAAHRQAAQSEVFRQSAVRGSNGSDMEIDSDIGLSRASAVVRRAGLLDAYA